MHLPFGSQQPASAASTADDGRYLPIADYGIIGNMRTCALVGKNGAIDWLCLPHFDSPSAFGALLDAGKGGRFSIAPSDADYAGAYAERQLYLPDTNVLITRFADNDSSVDLVDYMPVGAELDEDGHYRIIRRVEALRGTTKMRVFCQPAFDYAREPHTVHVEDGGVVFRTKALKLGLTGPVAFAEQEDGSAVAEFELKAGESAVFCLRVLRSVETEEGGSGSEPLGLPLADAEERRLHAETVGFWRTWLSQSTYAGRWRESVHRSALALKLLTFQPTGAIVAAPTTSLPEIIGGSRNWDYRYTWIRDAAFTLYGLLRIGFTDEVTAFIGWLRERCEKCAEGETPLQIVYGIDGRRKLDEVELGHLDGYRGSKPVRVGNGAAGQLQLDIFGELLDAVYLYDTYGTPISYDFWQELRGYVDWVCDNWTRTDEGIWEVRGEQQHFVYSKLMCWVALDRALRISEKRSLPAPRERWTAVRDEVYTEIMEKGYSQERGAFVQAFGRRPPRRLEPAHAARLLRRAERPADARHARRDAQEPVRGRPHARRARLPLRHRARGRRAGRAGRGRLQPLHVLARRGARARRPHRPGAARNGAHDIREDARLRQPPRPLLGGDEPARRGARQLPAGL